MDKMSVGITGPPHMLLSNKDKVYTVNFKLKNCLKNDPTLVFLMETLNWC